MCPAETTVDSQEGFLLGEVKRTTVNTVSDSYPDSSEELQIASMYIFKRFCDNSIPVVVLVAKLP